MYRATPYVCSAAHVLVYCVARYHTPSLLLRGKEKASLYTTYNKHCVFVNNFVYYQDKDYYINTFCNEKK